MNPRSGPPWRVRAARSLLRRLPRGRYHILATLAPTRGRFIGRLAGDLGGARFDCDLADRLSREVCFTGLYEPPVTRLFRHYSTPGAMVADVGANWGYFTLLAAAAVGPSGSVLALEPDPRQFDALSGNVALNGFGQVVCVQAAAAATEGRVTLSGFADEGSNRGISRIGVTTPSTSRQFDVRAVTLDGLTETSPRVDLVKIDVEGAEDLVLEGMRDGLASHRYRAVILELHPNLLRARGIQPEACLETMTGHGYRGWTIDGSPAAYRRAMQPGSPIEDLLLPLERWHRTAWPHLLWLC
jgi:FkbM family methyltransferase